MTLERYPPDYRRDELHLVYQLAQQGKSVAFAGLAGVGKSNLFRYLRDGLQSTRYLGSAANSLLFIPVDGNRWGGQPMDLWMLMGGGLLQATRAITEPVDPASIPFLSEEQQFFDWLKAQLRLVCADHGYQVAFLLDNFDGVLNTGPLAMIDGLSEIRASGDAGSVGRVSYVMFTQRLPHLLIARHCRDQQSSFAKLIRTHTYALGPYHETDARQMLEYLNQKAGARLKARQMVQLLALAGGHAGLISAIFDNWPTQDEPGPDAVSYFAQVPDVQAECRRVLQSLHPWEQQAAIALAQGTNPAPRWDVVQHLAVRGILTGTDPIEWFSPLLQRFLREHPAGERNP